LLNRKSRRISNPIYNSIKKFSVLGNNKQIVMSGLSDVQIMMAGSLRKRKDEEPIKSKEAKKVKLISAENLR
jgi:hypothetical protein